MAEWTPSSWQNRPAGQQPAYPDSRALAGAVAQLASLPPLVTSWEVERLKTQLAEAAAGKRFLLQGGACAERFDQCSADIITNKLKILLQMSLVLTHGLKRRIIRVGRFAGQYAKPRSADTEERDGITLPSYRGEIVNGPGFSAEERAPDPERMLRGFEHAAMTLNFIRSLVDGGFADLHHPEYWDLDFVSHSPRAQEYQRMVESISDSLRFMETLAGIRAAEITRVDFYTSHEALLLRAGTTSAPTFRGSVSARRRWTAPTCGRLTLIHRMGHAKVAERLPPLIEAVQRAERTVLWCCDPMHGNTETTAGGRKTRRFENILSELEQSFEIHADLGSYQGGVHFELSGDNVTECIGGARGLSEVDLDRAYESRVDPRLNYEQALEMALLIGRMVARMNSE